MTYRLPGQSLGCSRLGSSGQRSHSPFENTFRISRAHYELREKSKPKSVLSGSGVGLHKLIKLSCPLGGYRPLIYSPASELRRRFALQEVPSGKKMEAGINLAEHTSICRSPKKACAALCSSPFGAAVHRPGWRRWPDRLHTPLRVSSRRADTCHTGGFNRGFGR